MENPLVGKVYPEFPCDEFTDVRVISYQIANQPPRPDSSMGNAEPIPSVRFLFSNGEIRKWSRWFKISYHEKAALVQFFDVDGLQDILMDPVKLFTTTFKIMNERSGKFINVTKCKLSTKSTFAEGKEPYYDSSFVPLKLTKIYGVTVPLESAMARCRKTDDEIAVGESRYYIKEWTQDNMVDEIPQKEQAF